MPQFTPGRVDDNFRSCNDIRRALCHPLGIAHNFWSGGATMATVCVYSLHPPQTTCLLNYEPPQFEEPNFKLNHKVLLEFERRPCHSTHILGGGNDVYEPPSIKPESEAQVHVLEGSGLAPASDKSVEEHQRRLL